MKLASAPYPWWVVLVGFHPLWVRLASLGMGRAPAKVDFGLVVGRCLLLLPEAQWDPRSVAVGDYPLPAFPVAVAGAGRRPVEPTGSAPCPFHLYTGHKVLQYL